MYVFAAMICGYYHKPSHCLSIPQKCLPNFLSSPPHHLKSEYLPFLTWVVITVCVPETRSIGLKKTNSAGLFKAGLRQPRVSAKCEFTEFRNESLEIISV